LTDPEGIDEHRPLTASTLRQLLRLELSRFEPSPRKAIENERERRKVSPRRPATRHSLRSPRSPLPKAALVNANDRMGCAVLIEL
jgi:hypothetical protein